MLGLQRSRQSESAPNTPPTDQITASQRTIDAFRLFQWSLQTGQLLRSLILTTVSGDGYYYSDVLWNPSRTLVALTLDHSVRVFDIQEGHELFEAVSMSGFRPITFDRSGEYLLGVHPSDNRIAALHTASGKLLSDQELAACTFSVETGHFVTATRYNFFNRRHDLLSADARQIVTISNDPRMITVFEAATGKSLAGYDFSHQRGLGSHEEVSKPCGKLDKVRVSCRYLDRQLSPEGF